MAQPIQLSIRYVAKDWRKTFKFGPETYVTEAIATCLAEFKCGDRDNNFPPHQQYGLFLVRNKASSSTSAAGWLEPTTLLSHYVIGPLDSIEFHNRSDFIQLPPSMRALHTHYAEGWLMKRGAVNTSWKLRWFVLRNRVLSYYKKKTRSLSDEPAGIIELSQTFEFGIIPPDPKQKRGPNEEFQFQVTRPGRVYVLCAPNAAEMAHWLRIFKSLQMELSKSDLAAAADGSEDDDDDDEATQDMTAALAATDGGFKDVPLAPATPTASEAGSLASPSTSGGTSGLPTGDKAGYMGKRNQAGVWKVRWFVLKDKLLQYYKGNECRGFINLEGATITDESKGGKTHVFKLTVPNRVYLLSVDDPKEFGDWCEAFEFVAGIPMGNRGDDADDKEEGGSVQAPVDEGPVRLQGYLVKHGNNLFGDWRKRWCTVRGQTLYYRKSVDSKDVLGSIPLGACTLREVPGRRPHVFVLSVSNRQYQLQASGEDDLQKWLGVLKPLVKTYEPATKK